MKASEKPFLQFLQGTNQFRIPIYQRTYSWTRDQCAQLWDDIVRTAGDKSPGGHFVGSIVYIASGLYQVGTVPELLVIDGQQRLATISLLLTALGRALPSEGNGSEMTGKKLANYYLFNSEEHGTLRYKLSLTRSDHDTLRAIVDGDAVPEHPARRLVRNFEFFTECVKSAPLSLDDIFSGIQRLMIVDIALDRTYDNPQLIFESLNSTGLALTEADLIRNYVLMGLPPDHQDALYTNHWYPMEQGFGTEGYTQYFDRFVRDYLTLKMSRIPNIDQIYAAFKEYARSAAGPIDALVSELQRSARHFASFALEREPDAEIRRAFHNINTLRVDVAYPLLLHLADLRERGSLDKQGLLRALRLVESYVFRRLICGIPTNTLGKTFAALPAQVTANDPVESLEAALLLKDSYRRFPDDAELKREFVAKDIYNLRNRNYILRKLENYRRKEPVDVEAYTIEHVMPQNPDLSAEWQLELGPQWQEVQARYLHTIGNLTLTGYNSELSDRPFSEKQSIEGGFKDSPIHLNSDLAKREHWNEKDITDRARRLAELAVAVWKPAVLPPEVLDLYRPSTPTAESTYTLAAHPHLKGDTLVLFEELRGRTLNIDSSVFEDVHKLYIAFKNPSNFLDVVPQKGKLKLSLSIDIDELNDPNGLARDVRGVGHWGNGNVELTVSSHADLEYAMTLVRQAYEAQSDPAEL
jgi:uncharacterized protein with ParB-like and HNH nuclease domain/predicted transport protein